MEGYPKLAALQGTYPELAIYRRFSTLNARNILYLQAELVDLEDQLNQYTLADIESKETEKKRYSRNWFFLSKPNDSDVQNSQWHTILRIREKLKDYNECLIQQQHLATFARPETGNLSFLQSWLSDLERGNYALEGLDRSVWDSKQDLIVTTPDQIKDSFTRHLIARCFDYYHLVFGSRRKPTDVESGVYKYEEKTVLRAADIIGTLISSLLPVLAVMILYFVKDMIVRLGLVAMFTVLFLMVLVLVTTAKRVEIFAATAAFSSVQVVFGSTSV